jgi:diaminopimelate decarboxylase
MFGKMPDSLKVQFGGMIPEFTDYAAVSALPFAKYFAKLGMKNPPLLIIEPGTALVADVVKFVCKVISIKEVRNHVIVSLTGSIYNINPSQERKNMPVTIYSAQSNDTRQQVVDALLAGYTCVERDYLYKGYTGPISVGDYVVFDNVGSYSIVMKPPFILPNVAILEVDYVNQTYRVIKRKESFEDVFHTYIF